MTYTFIKLKKNYSIEIHQMLTMFKERARNIMMLGHQFHNLALLFNFMIIQNNKRLCSKWFSYQILRNTTFDLNKCEIFCQNTTLSTSLCSVDASSNVTAVSLKEGRKVCAAFEGIHHNYPRRCRHCLWSKIFHVEQFCSTWQCCWSYGSKLLHMTINHTPRDKNCLSC